MSETPVNQEQKEEKPSQPGTVIPAIKDLFDELKLVSDGFLECMLFLFN